MLRRPDWCRVVIASAVAVAALLFVLAPAFARWKPEYASASPEEQAWYQRQQTAPEWRKRKNVDWYKSCCDHSDVVKAKFAKADGRWKYQEIGSSEWKDIPDDVVQPDVMTPRSQAILFIDSTWLHFGPVCFFPGGTGA